ncbi:uncharacterized protein B0H64DRAFT_317228 [Chaetomium fimeti]|uniref:Protein kinase domain-containing protein n=1 Tax=Chaetomium fimeti TaxID=1854472 RepID=A0AAE0HNT7_9PEZI|nr:hypothetical protein B0H64DRAFT_317228 [Chaetomium fimeti]
MSSGEISAFVANYRYNGQLFAVLISDEPPEPYELDDSIEGAWIEHLNDLSYHDGEDDALHMKQIDGLVEAERKILDVVFPTLEKLAPVPLPTSPHPDSATKTIEEYLFPTCVRLELVTKDGMLKVISGHHREMERAGCVIPWSEMGKIGVEPGSVDLFPADHVLLGSRLVMGQHMRHVYDVTISGVEKNLVGKLVSALFHRAFLREVEIYGKLKGLKLDPEIRIPEFKGLITSGDGVVGLIVAKIPTQYPSLLPIVTDRLPGERPEMVRRQRWAAQVEHTVTMLHQHGIVWGDAKPDNIVVDQDDNTWLLDFGGGITEGWVEPSMFHTKEGDLHAVAKMKEGLLDQGTNGGNKTGTK